MGGITLIFENTCNCIFEEEVLEKAIIQECNSRGVDPKNNYKIYLYRGYAGISIKHDKVSVHRIIANYMAGQRLSSNISVHHIDGNKLNNRFSNLQILRKELHSKEHNIAQFVDKKKLAENAKKGSEARIRKDVTKEHVLNLKKTGLTILEISERLNCGYSTVCRRLGAKDY